MTLSDIIKKYNIDKNNYEIKKNINLAEAFERKYIEICKISYEDKKFPYEHTRVDVKGMGYEWYWANNKFVKSSGSLNHRQITQEAKQMTKESIKNFNSQQLSDISQKITNAITDGDFSIDYEGELEDKTYKKLIELGYELRMVSLLSEVYSISWL